MNKISSLVNWIDSLEQKLCDEIGRIKSQNKNFDFSEFKNIAVELEKFIKSNTETLQDYFYSRGDTSYNELIRCQNYNDEYENILLSRDLCRIKKIFDHHLSQYEKDNKTLISKLEKVFKIINSIEK